MAYNATLFVLSHRGIFKYRTRKMVREAFEDRFNILANYLRSGPYEAYPEEDISLRIAPL